MRISVFRAVVLGIVLAAPVLGVAEEAKAPDLRGVQALTGIPEVILHGQPVVGSGPYGSSVFFSDDPLRSCLRGAGLFTIWPDGVSLVFPELRSELPFSVEAKPSREERNVSLVFAGPVCRVTMQIEMEIRDGDSWVRLPPVVE